jgi:hypothetical protein
VLLTLCAKNRALYELPSATSQDLGRRGRRRKYGERAKKPFEWLEAGGGWRRSELMVRARQVPMRSGVWRALS